jgi:hypothetical protein
MADRDRHVAAAVNGKIPAWTVLCDQWTDEALITFLNGAFTLIARHADWGGRLLCVINDRAFHRSPKKTVMINNVSDHVTGASYN